MSRGWPLTRRQLLLGGAAASVGSLYGCRGTRRGGDDRTYDVAVIGSGFAGTPLALELARAGHETVVVEAAPPKGLDYVSRGVGSPFEFSNSGEIDYDINSSRVIGVGGTSRHWTGRVNRLRPSDFRTSSEFGLDVDWPITFDTLAPYYCRAEKLLSVTGRAEVSGVEPPRACPYPEETSYPAEGEEEGGPPIITFDGRELPFFEVARSSRGEDRRPVRLAQREIPQLVELANATLLPGRQATELVTLDGRTIDHVVLRTTTGEEERLRARRFVVAAGVFETPRLLLQSRSRWFPDGLGNNHDLLGRFFVEHPTLLLQFAAAGSGLEFDGTALRSYHFADLFRAQGINACHYQFEGRREGQVVWKVQPELEPRPENRVTLSDRLDRFGSPTIDLAFTYSGRDRRSFEHALALLGRHALGLGVDRSQVSVARRFRDHPSGTCRMGFDPSDGVVDRDNRVFGVENLYVSGATTFPTSGTSNPTNTVVAMTLRLADHLLQGL